LLLLVLLLTVGTPGPYWLLQLQACQLLRRTISQWNLCRR
jgi:hypothetical protein